jgi:hypothetical protein
MRRAEKVLLVLAGITIGACATQAVSTAVHTAQAQGAPRCDYSYILDTGMPELGKRGEVSYDDDWHAMVAGGWRLKTVSEAVHIFERCAPAAQ